MHEGSEDQASQSRSNGDLDSRCLISGGSVNAERRPPACPTCDPSTTQPCLIFFCLPPSKDEPCLIFESKPSNINAYCMPNLNKQLRIQATHTKWKSSLNIVTSSEPQPRLPEALIKPEPCKRGFLSEGRPRSKPSSTRKESALANCSLHHLFATGFPYTT